MGWEYPTWSHINGPAVNLLKGGVLTADRVMTVSKVRRQGRRGTALLAHPSCTTARHRTKGGK
jgi:hypothetical protein